MMSAAVNTSKQHESNEIVARCQQGDRAAFDLLFTRYQGQVYRLALALMRHVQDAEDVVQDVFVGLTRSIRTFDPQRGSFDHWLNQVVVNNCRRKQQYKRFLTIPLSLLGRHNDYEDDIEFDPVDPSPASLPENAALRNDLSREVWNAVTRLSDKIRIVVVLRYYMDMSCAEIAATLDCSEGTVHSRLHTARQRLQQALGDSLPEDWAEIGRMSV